MEKLKILHVIETLAVEGGGGDRACAELAEAQAQNGHDVSVLCMQYPERQTPIELEGVNVISLDSPGWFSRKLGWNPAFLRELQRELKDTHIVHSHGTWRMIQVYVRRACTERGIPYVHQPHGSFAPVKLRHRKWFKLIWGELFEKRNLISAAALHAETQADLAEIRAYHDHPNTYILPCGSRQVLGTLDELEFSRRHPQLSQRPYVLYLGRLDVQKGVDLLIKAFADVFAGQPSTALAIIGPDHNNTRAKLERQVREGAVQNVMFFPPVDEFEKRALYDHALCFVLPSHAENFGITVLEALLADCPVLVSRNTGWASLERDGGGLVFDPTVDDLSTALRRFLCMDVAERTAMIDRGREIAARYDWRAIARSQDAIYAAILASMGTAKCP
jgi:glycosyltransferase involved in cell wall biosynthesis